jgi:hypothetical protein
MSLSPTVTTTSLIPWGGSGVLTHRVDDRLLVALAEGSTCGFDINYANTADPYLSQLFAWLRNGAQWSSIGERTTSFLRQLRDAKPKEFDEDCPSLQIFVLEADDARASLHWIGGFVAQLVRNGRAIDSTTPHLLDTTQHLPAEASVSLKVIAGRIATPSAAPFESVTWNVRSGDAIVIVPHAAVCRAEWWPLPTAWSSPVDADAVVQAARAAHAGAAHQNVVGGKPVLAGAFSVVVW